MKKIFIDSDIFVRDLRYPRDSRAEPNRKFIERIRAKKGLGVTSIFNLLEICGILSFNLSAEELLQLYGDFINYYRVQILFPADANGNLQYDITKIFGQIQKKQSLGDAQISYVAERFASQLSCFVSWNAPHFTGKLSIPTKTPEDYLA